MRKLIEKTIKATIIKIIVALFSTVVIFGVVYLFFGQKINKVIALANMISIDTSNKQQTETSIDDQNNIKNYPEYGTQYATIEIPEIGVDLPVYFGDTLEILKNGVGHSSGSYFPGEGGSIIYMGHNAKNVFRNFSELKLGNEINVKTSYGSYTYKIYDMKIVNETDVDQLPLQKEKEILMVYTCYPFINFGYTTQRYVIYAELVSQGEEK